jgi:hypothetical protein
LLAELRQIELTAILIVDAFFQSIRLAKGTQKVAQAAPAPA